MTRAPEHRAGRGIAALRARPLLLVFVGLGLSAFVLGYFATTLLFFSGGPAEVITVPDLRGMREASARRELDRRGLELERGSALHHPEVPAGAVLAQSPLPGQEVAPGSTVRVTLSAGRDRRAVPDVSAFTQQQAFTLLARNGFRVVIDTVPDTRAAGQVVAVRPAPGTRVQLPAEVHLVISSGPPRVPVPDLFGLPVGAARQALESVGLRLGEPDYDPFAVQPPGGIIRQQPAAGEEAAVGSEVHVSVAGLPPFDPTETGVPPRNTPRDTATAPPQPGGAGRQQGGIS